MTDSKNEWAWMPWGGGLAHGPFSSREEALKDAHEHCDPGEEITVNTIWKPDFCECIDDAVEFIINIDECLDFCLDDPLFEFSGSMADRDIASAELRSVIKPWAEKWVDKSLDWILKENEKIVIGDETP